MKPIYLEILNLYNIIILTLINIFLFPKVLKHKRLSSYLFLLCCLLISFLLADLFYHYIDMLHTKQLKNYSTVYYEIPLFIYFLLQPFLFLCFIKFLLVYFNYKSFPKSITYICFFLIVLYLVFMFLTPIMDCYYYFDEKNIYHRGKFLFVSIAINGVFLFIGFVLLFVNKNKIDFIELLSVLMFFIIPVIAEFVQLAHPNLKIIGAGLSIPIIIIFCNLHKKLEIQLNITNNYALTKQQELESLQKRTIIGLSDVVENRGIETGNHVERITQIVITLAHKCLENSVYSQLIDEDYIKRLQQVIPLHDIGKIIVPDALLSKDSALTPTEFEIMKSHVTEGEKIVTNILNYETDKNQVKLARNLVKYHHEKWDGSGYPEGLIKEQIPLSARLMAIADVFDALVAKRVYKDSSWPIDKAFEYINSQSGIAFDPYLVDQFMLIKEEVARIFV